MLCIGGNLSVGSAGKFYPDNITRQDHSHFRRRRHHEVTPHYTTRDTQAWQTARWSAFHAVLQRLDHGLHRRYFLDAVVDVLVGCGEFGFNSDGAVYVDFRLRVLCFDEAALALRQSDQEIFLTRHKL